LQSKLLRVLEDRQVLRVGAVKGRRIDVRFIAATNRELADLVAKGAFRSDLYFRINGISLLIPPLRERRSEILTLAQRFIVASCAELGRAEPTLSAGAAARLLDHDWPGNIRELRNVMERAVLLADGAIELEHVPLDRESLVGGATTVPPPPGETPADLHREIEHVERKRILDVLERCGGNQSRAAIELGIARGTLSARLKAYGVKPHVRR
jgi:two-component system response regulator AtoC